MQPPYPYPVTFVSLGPGEAELITLKGLKALQAAHCIFCPETTAPAGHRPTSRAADIMHQLGVADERIRRFALPMSKQRRQALDAYDRVYAEAAALQRDGKAVCIVAEGDAGFYASIHYIYERLQADGLPVVAVPGIPAFIAAGARAGLHIASQEERLTVIPGTATTGDLERLLQDNGVAVIMKLSQCADEVRRCMQLHPEYRYHYFENVGTVREVCLDDVTQMRERPFPYFSLLIVRK